MFGKKKEKKRKREVDTTRDRRAIASVSPALIVDNWDHLVIDNDFVRMLIIDKWPNYLDINWAEPFIGLAGENAPITLVLKNVPGRTISKNINYSANEAEKWDVSNASETKVDREQREYEADQARKAAQLIVRSNAKIFEFYLYMRIQARNQEELEDACATATEHIQSNSLEAVPHFANQLQMYWASSPFMITDKVSEDRFNYEAPSLTIARGLWNKDTGICDPVGIPLGKDDAGGLVRLNPLQKTFSRINSNMFISGESGSGKSSLLKIFVTYMYAMFGTKVIINDVEGEFAKLTKELGGWVCHLNASSAMLISPFEPRNLGASVDASEEDINGEITDEEIAQARAQALDTRVLAAHLPFLVEYLLKAFSLNRSEHSDLLYMACNKAYNCYGISDDMTFGQYYNTNQDYPALSDVYKCLPIVAQENPESELDVKKIRRALQKAVSGPDKHMWEQGDTKIPDAPIMCIDLQGLSENPDMLAAQYYNILTWEWSQVRSSRFSSRTTAIVVDEGHTLVNAKNYDAAMQTRNMWLRARKYGGMMMFATPMISNIMDPVVKSAGEGIVNNSTYQFFGKTSGDLTSNERNNLKEVKALLSATDDVVKKLTGAIRGQFIVRAGSEKECWVSVNQTEWQKKLFGKAGGK